ncbi:MULTISPECIES: DUF2812 domain-containing protein [Paenibacillus]|uniref:DUF2812 domain-containing protein n=1 Tax=Paenibacillus albilobatus TaxID=2716884 RepID=A0A920CAT9_9BACL|nr:MULTISPECIES: DUF2812 domain-containing protein [Paenibacillus]GIO32635.1 hypothetical protein J2TS6_37760 [Paenibacillus albilobatus]
MKKMKFFTNFDREEQWLNEMARQGYRLVNKSMTYEFETAKPEEANYRIDYRTFKTRRDFEDYKALFEDCGWTHVAGTKKSGAQYFKQTGDWGDEDIFSDVNSKAARYKRISDMWLSLACSFIPLFAVLISTGAIQVTAIVKPKLLYYTPGLWEMSGSQFWRSFLFETPFAVMRGFSWAVIPIMILVYAAFAYKAKKEYTKSQQE